MTKKSLLFAVAPLLAVAAFALPSSEAETGSLRILKFEADWCGPCQQMKPIFKKVSEKYGSEVAFQSINVDSQNALAERFNIEGLPTVIALKDGREVGRHVGYMSDWKLNFFVKKHR